MPEAIADIRGEFPILDGTVAYLDNASTVQKPRAVTEAMNVFLETSYANVNRGVHALSERATQAYDDAREAVRSFIGARHAHEIIFTRNATEGINLVARSWGESLREGDIVALTLLEHHSNIVPWLQLKERKGIRVEWIGIDNEGNVLLEDLRALLETGNVKMVSVTALSNVLGVRTPLNDIIPLAHEAGAKVLVDAAQLAPHAAIDTQHMDADFLVFSGHKLYGPTGIGVLYGKEEALDAMPPFLGGGDMIRTVTQDGFTPAELPRKFEAGTPPIVEAVGLAAAMRWITDLGWNAVEAHEKHLLEHAHALLRSIDGVRILGPKNAADIASCISFVTDGVHPHDLTQVLSDKGYALRGGHHCTQPLHAHLGIPSSTRLSVAAYNTTEEIDGLDRAMREAISLLKK